MPPRRAQGDRGYPGRPEENPAVEGGGGRGWTQRGGGGRGGGRGGYAGRGGEGEYGGRAGEGGYGGPARGRGGQYGGGRGGESGPQDWRAEASYQQRASGGGGGRYGGGGGRGYGEGSHSGGSGWDRGSDFGGGRAEYGRRGRRYENDPISGGRRGGRGGGYGSQQHSMEASTSSSGGSRIAGSWAAPAPPLSELIPGFSGLALDSEPSSPPQDEGDAPLPPLEFEALSLPATSKTTLVAPKRPPIGKLGTPVLVRANHFKVDLQANDGICQYDVEVTPKISSKALARRLERHLLTVHKSDFGSKLPVYDGSKSLYSSGELPFRSREFTIALPDERVEKKYTVAIRHVATFSRKSLENFLQGRQASIPQEHLQALDIAFREFLFLHFVPVSRSFYRKELGCSPLKGGLVAWNGFYQSLRATGQGLALNVDLSTTAFYESINVIDFLKKKLGFFDPMAHLKDATRMQVKKALGRLRIEVVHRQTARKYRVSGLSSVPVKDLKFPLDGGGEMSIIDYFRNTYNYEIKYLEMPCIQVQASKTSYLPMEVCKICDGQKYGGKLTDEQTTSLREIACQKPWSREGVIKNLMHNENGPGSGDFVHSFGLRVSREPTTVRARLLRPPKLKYGEDGAVREVDPKFGCWNMLESCVVEGGRVLHWALISFDNSISYNAAYDFAYNLSTRCGQLGVTMVEPVVNPVMCRNTDLEGPHLENRLRHVTDLATRKIRSINESGHLQLLVCIMGGKHAAYGELKRICETQIGVVTQCCLTKHVRRSNSQYLANLALKINAKVGGRNNRLAVELPQLCHVFRSPAIIFGADVTHPHPGDDSSPSISALVANTDWPSATRYVARVRAQPHREEIIVGLKGMVQELWREFCEKTRLRPDRVVMFRDGVSEGQFDTVLQREVVAFKEALHEVGGVDYKPSITWVVVQKRHHTRLFPADSNKDKSGNVVPGTVVDHTITHPREFDFYLCSHQGIQGTSRPTHYHVLWDENGFSSDELQGLINNLCYTYARCTRSVSVVPPAYYAHLAAYRARLYIEGQGGSDTASQRGAFSASESVGSSGKSSRPAAPPVRSLPQILKKVQEVMYFC